MVLREYVTSPRRSHWLPCSSPTRRRKHTCEYIRWIIGFLPQWRLCSAFNVHKNIPKEKFSLIWYDMSHMWCYFYVMSVFAVRVLRVVSKNYLRSLNAQGSLISTVSLVLCGFCPFNLSIIYCPLLYLMLKWLMSNAFQKTKHSKMAEQYLKLRNGQKGER